MPRNKFSFLVTLWLESAGDVPGSPGDWRGSVEHLASGRRLYFNEIASLVEFLATWLAGRRGA